MIPLQSGKTNNMAGSPPVHPGFGNSGKSFLIENLLRTGPVLASEGIAGGHQTSTPLGTQRRTWGPQHFVYQDQSQNPSRVKDTGVRLPHLGNWIAIDAITIAVSFLEIIVFEYILCVSDFEWYFQFY